MLNVDGESATIYGCTDASATNYNADATEDDGYFKIGDEISFTYTFSENVIGSVGSTRMTYLNSGYSFSDAPPTSSHSDQAVDYVVADGDSSNDLSIDSLEITFGSFRDIAGNDIKTNASNAIVVAAGNNIADAHDLVVDGIKPADFIVASVTTLGDSIFPLYWNSTNTGATSSMSLFLDSTLINGTIQMVGIIGIDTTSIGSAYTILRSEEHTSELQSQAYLVCRLLLEKKT